jgi:hypothetical protein
MGIKRERANPDAAKPNRPGDYRPEELGREFDRGYTPHGYQLKEKVTAIAKCPTCQKDIALVAKTEEWEQREGATWEHAGWGPASGVCCDNLIVEFSNGYEVYPLPPRKIGGDQD